MQQFVEIITVEYKYKMEKKIGGKEFHFDELVSAKGSGQNIIFSMKEFVRNWSLDNGKESNAIKKRVNSFKNSEKWYGNEGVPHTLGLLLSGPPGRSETSTIKCVASTMERQMTNIITKYVTKTQMEHLFSNDIIFA